MMYVIKHKAKDLFFNTSGSTIALKGVDDCTIYPTYKRANEWLSSHTAIIDLLQCQEKPDEFDIRPIEIKIT